jgi:phage baseplate assembly protein V
MSIYSDVQRIIGTLRSKVFLSAGRGTLKTSDNSKSTAKMQGEFLKDEIISDIEKMEDYGFSSRPEEGAQIVAIFIDGNREQGLVVRSHDRRYRPVDLQPGEACMYHKDGSRVTMKANGDIELDVTGSGGNIILKTGDASIWLPNILGNCAFTGAPHGGAVAGIKKLKGG